MRSRCRSAEQALALARGVGAREAEVRALTVLGGDLAYLGRGEEGLAHFRQALQLAEEIGDHIGLERAYVNLTDALTMLGRPRESARAGAGGARGDAPVRDRQHPARREPDRGAARDRRVGRGRQAQRRRAPRHHLELPVHAAHHPRRPRDRPRRVRRRASAPRGGARHRCARTAGSASTTPTSQSSPSGSAAGRTPTRPSRRVWRGRASARPRRSASGCAPRDCAHRRSWRRSPAPAGMPTPSATGSTRARKLHRRRSPRRRRGLGDHAERRRLARPGRGRVRARPRRRRGPSCGRRRQTTWERLERPPLAAYCRWREAEALVAAGASRTEASVPLREAHAVAAGSARSPCCGSSSCSPSARGSISTPPEPVVRTAGRAWRRSSA